MATAGNTSTSFTSFVFADGTGTFNQNGSIFTMPEDGIVTDLNVCCAADSASCTFQLGLWDGSGNVIGQSNTFTQGTHSRSTSGWSFTSKPLTSPVFLTSGQLFFVGFWRADSGSTLFPIISPPHTGGRYTGRNAPSSITDFITHTNNWAGTAGDMGAYVTYTPGKGIYIRQSGAWVLINGVYRRASGVWTQKELDVRVSGAWKRAL